MLHYLKGPITEERISKLSKRKRKRHRVGEFQQLCFMFLIPMEDLNWNNKTLDLIVDYYTTSGCLDAQPDDEGYINIDQDEIVNYIVKESAKDGMGPFDPDAIFFVVQGEMEYGNQLGQVE